NSLQFQCLDSLLSVSRFLILSHKKCDSYKFWNDYVPLDTMRYAVLHCDVQVRLAAWILLCEHPQRTHAFTVDDLQLIRVFLMTNMPEQAPAIRQKILSGLKKVLCRMAETSEQVLKGKGDDIGQVENYNNFIRDILSLSYESLSPGANFCRRIMALSILQCFYVEDIMRPHGKTMFFDQLNLPSTVTPSRFAALVSCLDDSFQLCQITALEILKNLPIVEGFDFEAFKSETIDMMRSIRSHNTLATGYRVQFYVNCHPSSVRELLEYLVNICAQNTKAAQENLLNITYNSIHPWMNAIAILLENTDFSKMDLKVHDWWIPFLQQRIIPLCFDVAAVVTPAVHSMSPEGYIPEETLMKMATEPPGHPSQSLKVAMMSLLEMSHKSVTYRVHSLNVLKAIFSSATLGDRVAAALEWACRVAVSGCSAATWPERNAAAQLAAALRARIFGVAHKSQRDLHVDAKNRQSSYEFFSR
ncbi:hypothetical protein OSTOST_16559, partial [Ostertagia ostertagi]